MTQNYTLAELCISATAEAWRDRGEILATGIGLVPRLAASLAKMTFNPDLMMTDGEAYLVSEPVPVGPLGDYQPKIEGWMTYDKVFDNLWGGRRHAVVTPTQIDKYGQSNITFIGDRSAPKVALLGVRGYPGNSTNHANSFFVPGHNTRCFVEGEVDMVGGIGYNPSRWPGGRKPKDFEISMIVTDLAIMDFQGPDNQMRVTHLHPGIELEQVRENTSFELATASEIKQTPAPTPEQLEIVRTFLDPHDLRASVFKGNPAGDRRTEPHG